VLNYLLISGGILFLGVLGYFCYVYLGVSLLEVGVPTKLPIVVEVVSAQAPALSEVPEAPASVVYQNVEVETAVVLREVPPAVELNVFTDVERSDLKKDVDSLLKVTNESTERRFAYYDDYFRSLQNGG
jgi:hypothetical protein